MESHVKIHTNWNGMIDRLECDDDESKLQKLTDNCTGETKGIVIGSIESRYWDMLRIFALVFAGLGTIGIVVYRSPYVAQRWLFVKMLSVHFYLGFIAVSMLLYLLTIILKRKDEEAKG